MLPRFESVSGVPAYYEPVGAADAVERLAAGLRLRGGRTTVEVTALAPDLFRIGMFPDGRQPDYSSWAVAKTGWEPGTVEIRQDEGEWHVSTPSAKARVSLSPIRIRFEDADGRVFAEDDTDLGMGTLARRAAADGLPFHDPLGSPLRLYKRHPATEHYFGCGERTAGLEKTGTSQIFWNVDPPAGHTASLTNLYTSIPFLLALDQGQAWGLFLDNTHRVEFDLARQHPERAWFGADGGDLIYYVFSGPTPRDVVRQFTELTGRTPMPPLWALGNQQSSWNYESAGDVRAIARGFRAHDIPCDALYLDIDHMEGYRVFTWDPERFPDPKGLINDLREQGFRLVTITDPGVKVDEFYPVYTSGRRADVYCKTSHGDDYENAVWPGVCAFPDFTSERGRRWWGDQMPALLDAGVAGIWCDMNEPSLFIPRNSTMPPTVVHPGDDSPRLHAQVHNAYGMQMARATREGLERLQPEKRPFVISRSGYAGLQRYALQWTGDNSSWWEHLWMSIPQLQNMGISGLAWVGVDVGGFWGDTDGELLTRWTEFGIFQPMCRNHTAKGTRPQEPWAFGEPYTSHMRHLLKLRQRLLPYLYTLFEECHRTGAPMLRPLLFEYPEDPTAYTADAVFLLGSAILVAPITRPGIEHRSVYLPRGTWFHWWTGERREGPAHVLAHAPLGWPAIYVRANAPVPFWPEMNHSGERPPDPLTIMIWPADGSGELTLYEDAGDGYEHERGGYARRRITCDAWQDRIVVELSAREGTYETQRQRIEILLHGLTARPVAVLVDGQPSGDWWHDDGHLSIPLPESRQARAVQVVTRER